VLVGRIIHPMCVIEEYIIINFMEFELNCPIIPIIIDRKIVDISSLEIIVLFRKMKNGMIFCQVNIIIKMNHFMNIEIGGSQKCNGAIANFVININMIMVLALWAMIMENFFVLFSEIEAIMSVIEVIVWMRKYFSVISDEKKFGIKIMIIRNIKVLISIIIHNVIQVFALRAISVVIIIVIIKCIFIGLHICKDD